MVSEEFMQAATLARYNLQFDPDPLIAQAARTAKVLAADRPSPGMESAAGVGPGQLLLGVYYCCPKTIVLYEDSIRRRGNGLAEKVQEVTKHEIEHWLGYDHTKGFIACAACIE